MSEFLRTHMQAAIFTLGRLTRAPFSAFMTIAVVAIALALPLGLFVVLNNFQGIGADLDEGAQISLFLKKEVKEKQAQVLLKEINSRSDIRNARYISPAMGLKEFEKQSGFENLLAEMKENPLPGVIEVLPINTLADNEVDTLVQTLKNNSRVESAQLDLEWVKRLKGIVMMAERSVFGLALLLSLSVLLIIGNTIRLATQNRSEEIEIIQMIGGTDAFIRRPFLYTGLFYGLFGAIIAWLLITFFMLWLSGPADHLATLYGSAFHLQGLNLGSTFLLLFVGGFLGLSGSWMAVSRYLVKHHISL